MIGLKDLLFYCFILFLCSTSSESFKILVYTNLFGHSHVKVMATVADALTDAGHNVTVLMPIIEQQFINKTCLKSTKNVIFVEQDDKLKALMATRSKRFETLWTSGFNNPFVVAKKSKLMSELFSEHCRKVMSEKKLIEQIKSENFDLAITEPFDTCAYAFFEAISIRAHVAVYSCSRLDHVSEVIGQPAAPSYVPGMTSLFGEKMNIWDRFLNFYLYKANSYAFSRIGDENYRVAKEFYPNIRSWREVVPEATFLFTNYIPYLDFPAPIFDKMIPIGGLTVKTDQKEVQLEEKWSKILDERKKNVLISFGSNARSEEMPIEYKNALLKVFQSMSDTTFIWKYENPEDPFTKHLKNVYLSAWLPQNELLADPRLTLFITHGGLASVLELAMTEKPAIMIPVAADQTRNAQMMKRHGVAAVLKKFDLANPVKIQEVIEEIMTDSSYRENAKRLAEILHNQPTDPKETLVKYVEFAARFGKLPLLDNYGRHQSFVEYFFLDIISIISFTVLVSSYLFYRLLGYLFRKCRGSSIKNKKE
ncbi:hypothetical protein GCK72_013639 [Caenorhabditis remanei]|uniref:UDP-glucuronosyltransferase n=1 Tax=Caenorhabditis remanei TaxID=31234 RepID=A0A6A5GRC5_CAERE|nr:hypothetical protein GCK72_013639 [Caenorhabditis remanei]KAF1757184.1 hypothetical protein GCK72_013639 [Caenorhabditis remanei]